MNTVGIAGATGYTGIELLRLLVNHPQVTINVLTAETHAGKHITEVAPSLRGQLDHTLATLSPGAFDGCDLVFLALPHTTSMAQVPALLQKGIRVVDLSADYRLYDADTYARWYKTPHRNPELLKEAVYGLTELHRERIPHARLVANPGCYPTGAILALAPVMKADWAEHASIVVDSKSGASGAGRKASLGTQFCEANEGVSAYGVAEHRHTPEIEQELTALAGKTVTISFTPHLMPMNRGLLTTVYLDLKIDMEREVLRDHFLRFYQGEPFVRILPAGTYANTHHVAGSNFCDIGVQVDPRTRRAVITCAIDNLMKGASSQAVQNMNLMLGFEETTGLKVPPLFP